MSRSRIVFVFLMVVFSLTLNSLHSEAFTGPLRTGKRGINRQCLASCIKRFCTEGRRIVPEAIGNEANRYHFQEETKKKH